jgi:hypothetical protein
MSIVKRKCDIIEKKIKFSKTMNGEFCLLSEIALDEYTDFTHTVSRECRLTKLTRSFLDRRERNGSRLIERGSRSVRPARALSGEEIEANIVVLQDCSVYKIYHYSNIIVTNRKKSDSQKEFMLILYFSRYASNILDADLSRLSRLATLAMMGRLGIQFAFPVERGEYQAFCTWCIRTFRESLKRVVCIMISRNPL